MNRCLDSRWKALLACCLLTIWTSIVMECGGYTVAHDVGSWFGAWASRYLGRLIPTSTYAYQNFFGSFSLLWYYGIVLRLDWRRLLGWLALSTLATSAYCHVAVESHLWAAFNNTREPVVFTERFRNSNQLPYDRAEQYRYTFVDLANGWEPAAYAACLALPGVALIGGRRRPWMSIVAGVVTSAALSFVVLLDLPFRSLIHTFIYGGILLYGTSRCPDAGVNSENAN